MLLPRKIGVTKRLWQEAEGEPWPARIRWLIDTYYKGDHKELAKALDIDKPETVRLWQKAEGWTQPSMPFLAAIVKLHHNLNPRWFLTGVGPRLAASGEAGTGEDVVREMMTMLSGAHAGLAARYGLPTSPAGASLTKEETVAQVKKATAVPPAPRVRKPRRDTG